MADADEGVSASRFRLDPAQHLVLQHLHRGVARELVVRPHGPAPDLLMAAELAVRLGHDLIGLVVVAQDEDGVDLDVALGSLQAHHGGVAHARRRE